MQKKQAEMKAMLAKGFKKEKAVKEFQDMQIDNRKFDLEKKQEHYGLVKERKQKEDRQFHTKMNEAVKKYNEKHALVEANRHHNLMAVRNQTVDESNLGSQTKLDHMTSAGQLNYNKTSRMQSAQGRVDHILEGEDI